jgi:hypothetical protein
METGINKSCSNSNIMDSGNKNTYQAVGTAKLLAATTTRSGTAK